MVCLHPNTPPRPQILAIAPSIPSCRLAAIVVFITSSGWPSVVTSNMFNPAPRSKLENFTGFFSILGLPMPNPALSLTAVDDMLGRLVAGMVMAGPRQMTASSPS